MEELILLRKMVEDHDYQSALALIDEMEEMSRDDKLNKVESYIEIILIHLIKQQAEKRTSRSWDLSIRHSLYKIYRVNKRRKAGGFYQTEEQLNETITESFPYALDIAASEAFEGQFSPDELLAMIDADQIKKNALQKVLTYEP